MPCCRRCCCSLEHRLVLVLPLSCCCIQRRAQQREGLCSTEALQAWQASCSKVHAWRAALIAPAHAPLQLAGVKARCLQSCKAARSCCRGTVAGHLMLLQRGAQQLALPAGIHRHAWRVLVVCLARAGTASRQCARKAARLASSSRIANHRLAQPGLKHDPCVQSRTESRSVAT